MRLFVASDLHLDEAGGARLFRDERQGRALGDLVERVLDADAELVLDGDTLDLTATEAPPHGLEAFARAVGMTLPPPPKRTPAERARAIARDNPHAVAALARAAARGALTLVHGNHDRHLNEPGGEAILEAAGLGEAALAPVVVRALAGKKALVAHGHAWDPGNATPDGGGEALTQALHHAVVPFLLEHGSRHNVRMDVDRVVALRPEESVIAVFERWLTPDDFDRFFRAFLKLLGANGVVPRAASLLARFLSPETMRRRVEKADALWERSGRAALHALASHRPLPGGPRDADVLVLGHTHVLDWAVQDGPRGEQLYVNLGTWTERAFDGSSPSDRTLPVLEVDDEDGELRARLFDLQDPDVTLQRFGGDADRRAPPVDGDAAPLSS